MFLSRIRDRVREDSEQSWLNTELTTATSSMDQQAALEQATLEVFPKLSKRALFLPVIANLATLS